MTVSRAFETKSSLIAYGLCGDEPVVIKLVKHEGDEWRAGDVLEAFEGRGMVRALGRADGAVLLEHLDPATSLSDVVRRGDDAGATEILCDVIHAMAPRGPPEGTPTVRDWARGFDRYSATGDTQIPPDLVTRARHTFLDLSGSQRRPRLLHGDLHHDNVRYDRQRGWIAIDPKGVVGELEYEIGAGLRNPTDLPGVFATRSTVERRIAMFISRLSLDPHRILEWAFAQAVLSAIWSVEDGEPISSADPALLLAGVVRTMLGDTY